MEFGAWSADLIAAAAMDMLFGLSVNLFRSFSGVFFMWRPFASQRSSSSSSGLHHLALFALNDFTHLLLRLISRSVVFRYSDA